MAPVVITKKPGLGSEAPTEGPESQWYARDNTHAVLLRQGKYLPKGILVEKVEEDLQAIHLPPTDKVVRLVRLLIFQGNAEGADLAIPFKPGHRFQKRVGLRVPIFKPTRQLEDIQPVHP